MKSLVEGEGTEVLGREHTHTHVGSWGKVWLAYIYICYIYMLSTYYYTYKVVSMQQVHVKVVHILIRRVVRGSASG